MGPVGIKHIFMTSLQAGVWAPEEERKLLAAIAALVENRRRLRLAALRNKPNKQKEAIGLRSRKPGDG